MVEQSDLRVSENILSFAIHPLFAILRADEARLPKAGPKDAFEGGLVRGKLVVARVDSGAPVCVIPVLACI